MAFTEKILTIIEEFDGNTQKFKEMLERFTQLVIHLIETAPSLSEEMANYDISYQFQITDIGLSHWFEIKDGQIIYGFGERKDASITVVIPKDKFTKMLQRKVSGMDLYMRGEIKANGSLSDGFKLIKLLRSVYEYINTVKTGARRRKLTH